MSDKKNGSPINFQPMPKRFMVFQQFASQPNNWYEAKTCYGHEICIGLDGRLRVIGTGRDTAAEEFLINNSEIIICQSTNLFDKDGEEIFEGSIVEANWGYHTGTTYLDNSLAGIVKNMNGVWCIAEGDSDEDGVPLGELPQERLTLRGHILSDSKLLEEK